jgi:hypothetical protein
MPRKKRKKIRLSANAQQRFALQRMDLTLEELRDCLIYEQVCREMELAKLQLRDMVPPTQPKPYT